MNAIIKYPGAKWGLAKWIINLFPEHHSYVEPYFGSGAVFFNKQPSDIETVNDLDGNVVNLFECMRSDPEKLARLIYLTPYARDVYEKSYAEKPADKYEQALSFLIRLNMGHGYRTTGEKVGWKMDIKGRERAYALTDWSKMPDRVIQAAERLRGVQIENRPAIDVIKRFNHSNVLIYCDPPYLLGTRHGKQYHCEMTDSDHEVLLSVLLEHQGPAVISGYESDLYNDMLKDWHKSYAVSYDQLRNKKKEVIWLNYEPDAQMRLMV